MGNLHTKLSLISVFVHIEARRLSLSSGSHYSLPDMDDMGLEHVPSDYRASTVTINYLSMPKHHHRPTSPGGASVQSYWSELVRLKDRRDSTDSFLSQNSVASYQSKHSQ